MHILGELPQPWWQYIWDIVEEDPVVEANIVEEDPVVDEVGVGEEIGQQETI